MRIHGIDGNCVLLGPILIPECTDSILSILLLIAEYEE